MDKSGLRQYQDRAENTGWRIAMIPFDNPGSAMKHDTNWLGLLFMILFIASAIFVILSDSDSRTIPLMGVISGLLGMFVSVFVMMRLKYKHWVKVTAQCLDQELKIGLTPRGYAWSWRWLCEYQLGETTYRVTPTYWLSWGPGNNRSKRRALSFGDQVVDSERNIELWINPTNPLQAEVVGCDIKDFFFH